MAVYIDVLLIINFYVTYFLILATALFMHRKVNSRRKLLGSATGAATSFTIFLPQLDLLLSLGLKIAVCCIIVLIVFGFGGKREYLKTIFFFLVVNFVFAGGMLALWLFSCPANMIFNNGVVYFDISLYIIIISATISYLAIKAIRYFLDKNGDVDKKYILHIENNGCQLNINGICDSGNSLTDFFTGMPVVICGKTVAGIIAPKNLRAYLDTDGKGDIGDLSGIKILPCRTVSGNGLVYGFKADKVVISADNDFKDVNVLIGICDDENINGGIFNPKILL